MRGKIGWVVMAVAAASLVACGGSSSAAGASSGGSETADSEGGDAPVPNGVVHQSGAKQVEATLGPAGGSLSLATGPKVEIPPGSIEGAEEIVLKEAPMTTAFSTLR